MNVLLCTYVERWRHVLFVVASIGGIVTAGTVSAVESTLDNLHVTLVGASIGQEWKLTELPQRRTLKDVQLEALQVWQFDKSEVVEELLLRPARKFELTRSYLAGFFKPSPQPPDVIVLKECSAYFPSNLEADKTMVQRWVKQISDKGIGVMLATTVPVTQARAAREPGKMDGIRAYNAWVREYAHKHDIVLMDLEKTLSTDGAENYLRDDLTSGDGSHLNRKAYDLLDASMIEAIEAWRSRGFPRK